MNIGDIVKFSETHYKDRPGYEYVKDWIGIVVETQSVGNHYPIDEMKIMWTTQGRTLISKYDELWWNKLEYEPFVKVINESH